GAPTRWTSASVARSPSSTTSPRCTPTPRSSSPAWRTRTPGRTRRTSRYTWASWRRSSSPRPSSSPVSPTGCDRAPRPAGQPRRTGERVRLLVSPGALSGALSALAVAAAVERGWRRTAPDTVVHVRPMSDGATGLLDAVHAARGGRLVSLTARGPLGDPVPATLLHVPGQAGGTVYVEAGQVLGSSSPRPVRSCATP